MLEQGIVGVRKQSATTFQHWRGRRWQAPRLQFIQVIFVSTWGSTALFPLRTFVCHPEATNHTTFSANQRNPQMGEFIPKGKGLVLCICPYGKCATTHAFIHGILGWDVNLATIPWLSLTFSQDTITNTCSV